MKEKSKYTDDLPGKMYTFFRSYVGIGAPSFSKFAREVGLTLAELMSFRERRTFMRACEECSEIRRDYLIDQALAKKQDASMTKFILSSEFGMGEPPVCDDGGRLEVHLEVIG